VEVERVSGREIEDENDSTDRKMIETNAPRSISQTFESSSKIFICVCIEFIGESKQERLINDQSQPVQTEVADAGDDHQVLRVIDKTPPPKPSRTAKIMEVKEPKSQCSQQVCGSGYDHHQTYSHSHGV